MRSLPAPPDFLETYPGVVLVALHEPGLDLVIELDPETGETTAAVLYWGEEVLGVVVGRA